MPAKSQQSERTFLIAPCGMNCALCMAYQRDINTCPGCNGPNTGKPKSCVRCVIKNCTELKRSNGTFCFECEAFPCKRLQQLDKRYRTKYGMSMIDNLRTIEKIGIEKFVRQQVRRWKCSRCGELVSVHRPACLRCGKTMTATQNGVS
ncbi:MAG: DUF3795 domain-containing protein [Bacteroidota bacterium]